MQTTQPNNRQAILVIHEIYGINKHITDLSHHLQVLGFDVFVPDLLGGRSSFDYTQADEAYRYFTEQVGFERAAKLLKEQARSLRSHYDRIILVGFSIGATIAWLVSEEEGLCDQIVAYYGSRIRDYVDIQPTCPSLLLFAEQEKSFDVSELVQKLGTKQQVLLKTYAGEHGFTDRYGHSYTEDSAVRAWEDMLTFIQPKSQSPK